MMKEITLEKTIPEFSTIDIKPKDQNIWLKSIVLNVHGKFIEIKQIEQFLNSAIMAGDILKCTIITENSICLMEAEVYNIKFISGSVVLKIHDLRTIANERKHKRYNILLNATFTEFGKLKEHYCVVLNISISGLCIITNFELKHDDIIDVFINYRNSSFIGARYAVKWLSKHGSKRVYGLLLTYIDDKNKSLLTDLIDELEKADTEQIKQLVKSKREQIY